VPKWGEPGDVGRTAQRVHFAPTDGQLYLTRGSTTVRVYIAGTGHMIGQQTFTNWSMPDCPQQIGVNQLEILSSESGPPWFYGSEPSPPGSMRRKAILQVLQGPENRPPARKGGITL